MVKEKVGGVASSKYVLMHIQMYTLSKRENRGDRNSDLNGALPPPVSPATACKLLCSLVTVG